MHRLFSCFKDRANDCLQRGLWIDSSKYLTKYASETNCAKREYCASPDHWGPWSKECWQKISVSHVYTHARSMNANKFFLLRSIPIHCISCARDHHTVERTKKKTHFLYVTDTPGRKFMGKEKEKKSQITKEMWGDIFCPARTHIQTLKGINPFRTNWKKDLAR